MTPEMRAVLEALEVAASMASDATVERNGSLANAWNLVEHRCAAALAAPECVCAETSIRNCPVHGQDDPPGLAEVEAESVGSLRDDAVVSFRRAEPSAPAPTALDRMIAAARAHVARRTSRTALAAPSARAELFQRIEQTGDRYRAAETMEQVPTVVTRPSAEDTALPPAPAREAERLKDVLDWFNGDGESLVCRAIEEVAEDGRYNAKHVAQYSCDAVARLLREQVLSAPHPDADDGTGEP